MELFPVRHHPHRVKPYLQLAGDYDPVLSEKYNNGCGPGNWKGKLVPETNYGIVISDSCHNHDFDVGKVQRRGYFPLPDGLNLIVIEYINKEYTWGRHETFMPYEIYAFRFWSNLLDIVQEESRKTPLTREDKAKLKKMSFWKRWKAKARKRIAETRGLNILRRKRCKTYFKFVYKSGTKYVSKKYK